MAASTISPRPTPSLKPAAASTRATLGRRKVTFKIDAKAKTGKTPVVSRLLRFPPG